MVVKKKSKNKQTGLVGKVILSFNILVILGILLSYLSLYISPERNWLLPFFGLIYPYLLIINSLFVLYWLVRKKYYLVFSLIAILIGWNVVRRTIQIEVSTSPMPGQSSFLVMSYNVRNMANNNLLLPDFDVRNDIITMMKGNQPDIMCLQEFESIGPNPVEFIDSMATSLEMPYYHFARYNLKAGKRLDAIITFSRFPIVYSTAIKKDDVHNYCLISDILLGSDTVRVMNIHLESVRFKHEDYTFISDLDLQFEEDENIKEGSRRIFNKLRQAYIKRSTQVANLKVLLQSSPYPVILCGDFNDTPCSYSYQTLSRGLRDAFIESGSGFGNTYAGTLPSLRIDYIMYDPQFRCFAYTTGRERLSDHYPIAALIGTRKQP